MLRSLSLALNLSAPRLQFHLPYNVTGQCHRSCPLALSPAFETFPFPSSHTPRQPAELLGVLAALVLAQASMLTFSMLPP